MNDYNSHLVNALPAKENRNSFVKVDAQTVSFTIQSGPINEVGVNGCDATDIIKYAIGLYRSFNKSTPCRENSLTMTKLEEALHWQNARTADREARKVEGTGKE